MPALKELQNSRTTTLKHRQKPTLLLLTSSFPCSPEDEICGYVRDFARSLSSDFNVTVLAPPDRSAVPWPRDTFTLTRARSVLPTILDPLNAGADLNHLAYGSPLAKVGSLVSLVCFFSRALTLAVRCDVVCSHWMVPSGLVGALIHRLLGKVTTLAAMTFRHTKGLPYVMPDNDLSYVGNFMNMLYRMAECRYTPNPTLEKALDVLFILHADHEQNCSTNTMRVVASSRSDPYCAAASAAAALYGPLHGGANEEVLKMLRQIGSKDKVPQFIKDVKEHKALLMGFGHRVYKNYDPRAKVIKRLADEVFEVTGKNPLIELAVELERIALQDDYFVSRKLFPNVDFYSGIIYEAMGMPSEYFTVVFAVPRMSGWLAQWQEMILDAEQKIARPRQVYTGVAIRDYEPIEKRRADMQ